MPLSLYCRSALLSLALTPILLNQVQAEEPRKPKLILQITVDGLRGDLLNRYRHHFSQDGFGYLLNQGIVYSNANYQHANTETIVGHVSLATGAPPAVHGMVGNVWFDRQQDRLVYNVEDGNYHMLSKGAGVDATTEIEL